MTVNRRTGSAPESGKRQARGNDAEQRGEPHVTSVPSDTGEAILRQLVALRASNIIDDQLAQLIRMVDSASWSAPVPMTILVDGAVLRGALVPSEVSAAFLDDALRRSAHDAVDQLEGEAVETSSGRGNTDTEADENALKLQQSRSFLRRMKLRPFSTAQSRVRQRNASALMAIGNWHQARDHGIRQGPLDIPGRYTDPTSAARDVIPYTAGQRALTLADVKMMVAGEWLALSAPVRVAVGRIGAWTIDL